jgi:hypothetical protein
MLELVDDKEMPSSDPESDSLGCEGHERSRIWMEICYRDVTKDVHLSVFPGASFGELICK